MYYESEDESVRRLKDALGINPIKPFKSTEKVPESQKKLLTNIKKAELIA
jgi:hypothetical protein